MSFLDSNNYIQTDECNEQVRGWQVCNDHLFHVTGSQLRQIQIIIIYQSAVLKLVLSLLQFV